jgi:putative hemolysin
MKKLQLCSFLPAWGIVLWSLAAFPARSNADTVLYNDGTWIVSGIDGASTNSHQIAVSVAGQPAGDFTEIAVFRAFGGGSPQVYSIQADGGLQPAVAPTGVLGGTYHLTGYWDCFGNERSDLRFISLNIQSNTKKFSSLKFNGTVSNGTSIQATDLGMTLDMPNDQTVRLDVRYTLYATASVCVDQWQQQSNQGFQVVRIAANYISNEIKENDGFQVKGFLGPFCDCCDCWWDKGYICSTFTNQTGSVLPYSAAMSGSQLLVLHRQSGPNNTAALRVTMKNPSSSNCSVQGATVFSIDPAAHNVDTWINWDKAKSQYTPGQKIRPIRFVLQAELPQPEQCDFVVP